MTGHNRILIAETDHGHRALLDRVLWDAGHAVLDVADPAAAPERVAETAPDLAILGWPAREVCARLRGRAGGDRLPVLAVGPGASESACVEALDNGADDYLARPCPPRELKARVRALLRRGGGVAGPGERLRYGDITMDVAQRRVFRGDREVTLTPREFALLHVFLRQPGRVLARDAILDAAWGQGIHVQPRTVDVHVRRLRRALDAAGRGDPIRTARGGGYALEMAAGPAAARPAGSGLDEAQTAGAADRLGAVGGAQVAQDGEDMHLHRAFGEAQIVRDLLV